MSERNMRQRVVRILKPLHAFSIENPCRPGTPDLSYADGLLELKWARAWPTKDTSVFQVPHYTPQQRLFHRKRWSAGGKMFVLLQVANDWMIFAGPVAAAYLGYTTRVELEGFAAGKFGKDPSQLLPWLKSPPTTTLPSPS